MRFSTLLLLVPACVIAAMIAVANREEIAFTLVPFVPVDAGFTFVMPLFLLVFVVFVLGVLVGGATVALQRARRRGRRRISDADIARAMITSAGETSGAERPKA